MKAFILFVIPLLVLLTGCEKEGQAVVERATAAPEEVLDNPDDGRLEEGELQPIVVVSELLETLGFKVIDQISQGKFKDLLVENTELKIGQQVRFLNYTAVIVGENVCRIREQKDVMIQDIDSDLKVLEESEVRVLTSSEECKFLEQKKIAQRKTLALDAFSLNKQLERIDLQNETSFIITEHLGQKVLGIGSDTGQAVLVVNPRNSMLGNMFFLKRFEHNGKTLTNSERVMILAHGR